MMELNVIAAIQEEKDNEIARQNQPPLDAETKKLAEGKRFTFDVISTPVDPLR